MTAEQLGRLMVEHLQGWLRALQEADAAIDCRRDETLGQGLRIVSGGQISGWTDGKTQVSTRVGRFCFCGK